jgi:hypothetical protein
MSDDSKSERSLLVDALETHATWLVSRSSLRSQEDLVSWISPKLTEEAAEALETLLPLEHPAQKRAEEEICQLLEAEEAPERHERERRTVERPTRAVEWGESYANSVWNPPLEYVEIERVPRPDIPVMAALVEQARQWRDTLEAHSHNDRYSERSSKLENAISKARNAWTDRDAVLDVRKLDRLAQYDPDAATAIRRGLDLWGYTDSGDLGEAFREAFSEAIEREENVEDNDNTLLEILCGWSIARAVVEGDGGRDWQFADEPLSASKADSIVFEVEDRESGLCCDIRTGSGARPRDCIWDGAPPKDDGETRLLDRELALRRSELGEDGQDARQPDLTLHFTHADASGHLFAFGDAKNYEGDLSKTIKDTGTAYLFAFGALCGLPDEESGAHSPFEIATALRPPVTIFGRDGVDRVLDCDAGETDAIVEAFCEDDRAIEPIVVFGEEHYLGSASGSDDDSERENNEYWSVPVLEAWFERLASDAEKAFEDGRALEFREKLYEMPSTKPRIPKDS